MVDRGTELMLEPELYEAHAVLAARLSRSPAWGIMDSSGSVVAPEPKPVKLKPESFEDRLLPHQLEAIEKIRKNRERELKPESDP
jgi:hypothetical protein